jgi:signal peptidase II
VTDPQRLRAATVLLAVALAVLIVDVPAKLLAESRLADGPVELGPVALRLAHNPGVAFGLGGGLPVGSVAVLTGLLLAAFAVWALRGRLPAAPAGLIVGGGLGNLVDRAGDGTVTDYLGVGWWPHFNVADAAITVGAVLLVIVVARQERTPVLRPSPASHRR